MYNGLEHLIKKIQSYKVGVSEMLEKTILEEASQSVERKIKRRIFTEGLDSFGEIISDRYSTKPMTVQKNIFIKPSAFKGKKTMRLEKGYKELRDIQGLPTDKVNIKYSGSLKNALKVRRRNLSLIIGFSDRENSKKAKKLQEQYNTVIFRATNEEMIGNTKLIAKGLRKVQKQYFYG